MSCGDVTTALGTVLQFVINLCDVHSLKTDGVHTGGHTDGAQQPRASVSSEWGQVVAANRGGSGGAAAPRTEMSKWVSWNGRCVVAVRHRGRLSRVGWRIDSVIAIRRVYSNRTTHRGLVWRRGEGGSAGSINSVWGGKVGNWAGTISGRLPPRPPLTATSPTILRLGFGAGFESSSRCILFGEHFPPR